MSTDNTLEKLKYSHYFSLPTQGSIYTLANLNLPNGTSKLLVASLKREIYCLEYLEGTDGSLIPTAREVSFTYIPTGAEIISIDAYNKSTSSNEFVVGVAIIKNSTDLEAVETYLNIYLGWESSDDFSLENIAQNCQNVELNFTPYHLIHTDLIWWENQVFFKEKVFLLSGSDNFIHVYKEGTEHLFKEIETKDFFPEFKQYPSPVVWINLMYFEDDSMRLVATGCECGYLRFTKVNVKTAKVEFNFSTRLDNYISQVKLFEVNGQINLLVVNTILQPLLFQDVLTYGLANYECLPRTNSGNIFSCCEIADIDFDGSYEILIANSAMEILMYKFYENKKEWWLHEIKKLSSPIFSIKYSDLTGDGVKDLLVFSMKGLHVLQYDPCDLQHAIDKRLKSLNVQDMEYIYRLLSVK